MAIALAKKHHFKDIEALLGTYATMLLNQGRRMDAIELYRKANYSMKSALLLYDMALEEAKSDNNPIFIKKLFVLAALEVERHQSAVKASKGISQVRLSLNISQYQKQGTDLDRLVSESVKNNFETKFINSPWRHAEAYHLYILAQRQFYSANFDSAIITVFFNGNRIIT